MFALETRPEQEPAASRPAIVPELFTLPPVIFDDRKDEDFQSINRHVDGDVRHHDDEESGGGDSGVGDIKNVRHSLIPGELRTVSPELPQADTTQSKIDLYRKILENATSRIPRRVETKAGVYICIESGLGQSWQKLKKGGKK